MLDLFVGNNAVLCPKRISFYFFLCPNKPLVNLMSLFGGGIVLVLLCSANYIFLEVKDLKVTRGPKVKYRPNPPLLIC